MKWQCEVTMSSDNVKWQCQVTMWSEQNSVGFRKYNFLCASRVLQQSDCLSGNIPGWYPDKPET